MAEPIQERNQVDARPSADAELSDATAPAPELEAKQTQEEMLAAYRLQQQRMW